MAGSTLGLFTRAKYLIDLNVLLEIGERLYPPDVFGGVWVMLSVALRDGTVVTTKEVLQELKAGPEDPWRNAVCVASAPHAIDEGEIDVQREFRRLARLVGSAKASLSTRLSDIDLMVLSCAEARSYPIVTRDATMISACRTNHISTIAVLPSEMFRELGWRFPSASS